MKKHTVISLLSSLVSFDTQSHKDNSPLISFLVPMFKKYETNIQQWTRESDGVKGKNLIVKISGNSSDRSIIFVCHLDTVPTSDAWETNPFILEEMEGKLYGLGSCDTKGGIAALIEAVLSLKEKPAHDTYIVFDGDEESTWTGLQKYKKTLKVKNPVFICIEPTDNNMCISARGILSFKVHTSGKAQHASYATPEKNKQANAIYKMHAIMDVLMQDAARLAQEKDPLSQSNSQNFGVIAGGTAENVIADQCVVSVDRRLLPDKDLGEEVKRIKKLIHTVDKTASIGNIFSQQGFSSSHESHSIQNVFASVKKQYDKAKLTYFQAMSEGAIFAGMGDIIVLGPGSIQQAHIANEFVKAEELFAFVHIYKEILQTA